jgi:N-acetylglucosamine kinase-like BadF-type ATPase
LTSHILVALDSGGSRTNIELRRSDGTRLFSYEVGDVLSDAVHPSEYASVLRRILVPLETHWQDHLSEYSTASVFLSAAGFSPASRDDYRVALGEVAPSILCGSVAVIGAANDAMALILGHDCDGAVIAGTGSNVIVRDHNGHLHQSGGYGWVASDEGSGFWIGLHGIRQACMDLEDEAESPILLRLRQQYGIRPDERQDLIAKFESLCVADQRMLGEIAQFASAVCGAAERGDEVAQNIVKAEAEKLADNLARSVRRHFTSDELAQGLTFIENGGLLSNDVYRGAFETQVQMRLLSGHPSPAEIRWERVRTGISAGLRLAQRLTDEDADELLNVDHSHRPIVIRLAVRESQQPDVA